MTAGSIQSSGAPSPDGHGRVTEGDAVSEEFLGLGVVRIELDEGPY